MKWKKEKNSRKMLLRKNIYKFFCNNGYEPNELNFNSKLIVWGGKQEAAKKNYTTARENQNITNKGWFFLLLLSVFMIFHLIIFTLLSFFIIISILVVCRFTSWKRKKKLNLPTHKSNRIDYLIYCQKKNNEMKCSTVVKIRVD